MSEKTMCDFVKNELHNLLSYLKYSTHPEITHFRTGSHPGKDWYLKTVIPVPFLEDVDHYEYGALWQELSHEFSDSIKIQAQAYDWDGNDIPFMMSVWLTYDTDVRFVETDNGFVDVFIIDKDIGDKAHIDTLEQIVYSNDIDHSDENSDFKDLHNLINHMKSEYQNNHEKDLRSVKKFKLITGGKNK